MIDDSDVEERLRAALRLHAADAPPGAAMLGAVAAESRRRGRRARLATLSAAAAVLVTLGAAVPLALRGGAGDPPASAVAEPPSAAPVLIRSTVPAAVTFPFTPPSAPGFGTPLITLTAGHPTLTQQLPGGDEAMLTLYDARPATADDDPERHSRVWQPAPGAWLVLTASAATPAAELEAYAKAVVPGELTAPAPFTFGLMPTGWTVDNITSAVVTFCPPGVAPDGSFIDKIAVMLDESPADRDPSAAPVRVGTRPGWLTTSPEGQVLRVALDGGRSLLLQVGARAALPDDALPAFAAAIAVTPAARVSQG